MTKIRPAVKQLNDLKNNKDLSKVEMAKTVGGAEQRQRQGQGSGRKQQSP